MSDKTYYSISESYAFIVEDENALDDIVADGHGRPGTLAIIDGSDPIEAKILGIDGETWYPFDLGSSGGGGDGDWSSAEVTFECTAGAYLVNLCFGVDYNEPPMAIIAPIHVTSEASETVFVPLYKGAALLPGDCFAHIAGPPAITGNLTLSEEGLYITGDGTFSAPGE